MTVGAPRTIIAHVSSAHRTSDVRIHLREAATAAAAGYEVHVIANEHRVALPATGVTVHGLAPLGGRIRRMTFGSVRAIVTGLRVRPDVMHLHDPELVWAIKPLQLLGKRVVYDAHEDLPTQALSKEYLGRRAARVAAGVARFVIKLAAGADRVVAATETIAGTFPPQTTVLVRNFPTMRLGAAPTPIMARPQAVAYLGVMGPSRGSDVMIDSFSDVNFPDKWKAVIAGPATDDAYMQQLRNRPGWRDKVDYRGFLSTDAARDLLDECRVGIVTLKRTPAYLDSLPTKMFEYFAAGVPAIASDFPLWRAIIERYDCGLLVDETSAQSIAAAVAKYAAEPALLARHSENALKASRDHLNWNREGGKLLDVYNDLS